MAKLTFLLVLFVSAQQSNHLKDLTRIRSVTRQLINRELGLSHALQVNYNADVLADDLRTLIES